jgi:hypothetical protein
MSFLTGKVSPTRVLFTNRANDKVYTVAATTETSSFEVENAIDCNPKTTWKATGITQNYITFTGSSVAAIKGCYINNHNINEGSVTFNLETSDDNFSSTDTTTAFTSVTRQEIEEINGVVQVVNYNDAYAFISTTCKDVRVSMIKSTGSNHEIGSIYIFTKDFDIPGSGIAWNATRGAETVIINNTGNFGQQYNSFRFQRHSETFEYPQIPIEFLPLLGEIAANPCVVFMPDGIAGAHFLGKITFGVPVELEGGQDFSVSGFFTGVQ